MDTSRRRVVAADQTDGQSSDSDEVRVIEGNQPAKNKRVKKTIKKVKDKEEEELERTLRESGIDFTGMTKEEKLDIAQVIMMSKQEADERNQMEIDVGLHTDSEEEKQTSEAFQQAVHPSSQTFDLTEPDVQNASPLHKVHKVQSQGHYKDNLSANNQHHFGQQPETSVDSAASISPSDQTLIQSSQRSEAFEEAIHPRSTPEDEFMDEDPIPVTSVNKKVQKNVKHQKQQKRQTKSNQDMKNQTKIDIFGHIVIPDDRKSKGDNQVEEKLVGLISEDDSSPERKKRMTESILTADVKISTSDDECDRAKPTRKKLFEPNTKKELSSEDEQPDNKKSVPVDDLDNLISDDEENPQSSTSGAKNMFEPNWKDLISGEEDSSPIKRPTKGAKKTFVWSEESDEETQDLIIDKEEPFSEEFYKFPQLHRHYRSVRKQKEQSATLFAPPETDPVAYTKAIVQLFSLYHIRLTQLQRSSKHLLSWSKDPVKVGRHLDTTIDAKKRGLDYDFLEIDDEVQFVNSKSVVPAGVSNDVGSKQPLVKPATKNFNFKTRKDRNVTNPTPLEEIDDFVESTKQLRSGRSRNITKESVTVEEDDIDHHLDSFISKTTRNSRTRNIANFNKQKSAEDFEPFPVNESFKFSAEQGRKRKLYNENATKYCPVMEDDSSNDFDMGNKTSSRSVRIVKSKVVETSDNTSGRPGTQQKRGRANTNNRSATSTRGSLKRMPSDLSAGSVESAKSEELNNFLDPVRPSSRSSDVSLDGLSQSSDVLLDPHGQLYSTQFCAMQEKRAKTPTTKSYPTEAENEHLFRQYMSQQNDNEHNQQESNMHFSTSSATQSFENLSKASHETWSNVSSILPQTVVEKTRQKGNGHDENTDKDQPSTSLKSRLFKTVNNFIKLGPTKKTPERKAEQVNTEVKLEDHGVHATRGVESEHLMNTQGFQLPSDVMEDDIQQIHVNREGKTYSRKQGRKRQLTENDENQQNKVPKVNTFPCPLCNKQFPQDRIETHAADCNGPDDDENTRGSPNEIPDVINIEPSSSGMQRPNLPRMNRKQDEDEDFIIEDDDSDKENPTRSSLTCYVCDKVCRNQKLYDLHVEKCLEEATQRQHQMETRGLENVDEEEHTTPKRTTRSAKASINSPEGYSSGSENEKVTLRDIVKGNSSSSSEESSYSDEYDWSPSKTPPDYKPTNKENVLPGGWTLEELTNSPIRSYVPIWKQSDSEGFKTQFDKAKQRYQRQLLKGKGKRKQKGSKRRRKRKRTSKNKQAAKKTRLE